MQRQGLPGVFKRCFIFLVIGATPGITLCMCPANGKRRYIVMSFLISWAQTQNDPWTFLACEIYM